MSPVLRLLMRCTVLATLPIHVAEREDLRHGSRPALISDAEHFW